MTKEVRHCKVIWEKIVDLNILVDKDITDADLKSALVSQFEGFGYNWLFDEDRVHCIQYKKQSLKEYMTAVWGKHFDLVAFNDDMDAGSLSEFYQNDFHKLVKEQGEI